MNNKPDWKDAPEWANWLAQARHGSWYWFQEKPVINFYYADWDELSGKTHVAQSKSEDSSNWLCTLEERPR